jgi:hypothetical protein
MPTRRTLELIVIASVALRPVIALVRLWSAKTLASAPPGTVAHGTAEIGHVVTS